MEDERQKQQQQPEPAMMHRLVNGLLLTYQEPEKAFAYVFPGSGARLFLDEKTGLFLPAIPAENGLFRERTAEHGPDGAAVYTERLFYPPGAVTAEMVEGIEMAAAEKQARFWDLFWARMLRLSWLFPLCLCASFAWFVYTMSAVANTYAARRAGEMAGEAFGTIAYLAIFLAGGIIAAFILKFALVALFATRTASTDVGEMGPETTVENGQPGGRGDVIVNVVRDNLFTDSPAQHIINQRPPQ